MSGIHLLLLVLTFLHWAIYIYSWVFLIYILISWFNLPEDNVLVRILRVLCEPLYMGLLMFITRVKNFFTNGDSREPFRLVIGPIDLSPLLFYLFLNMLDFIVQQIFLRLAR